MNALHRVNGRIVIALLFAGAIALQTAQAQVANATIDLQAANSNPASLNTWGTLSGSFQSPFFPFSVESSTASAATSADLGPTGFGATASASASNGGNAEASVNYYFEIVGPIGNVSVPLEVSISLQASGAAGDSATATFQGNPFQGGQPSDNILDGFQVTPGGTLSNPSLISEEVMGMSEVVQSVSLGVDVSGQAANATVDSQILGIDPSWAAENPGYSIEYSPNLSAIPEPSTIELLAIGIFGMGFKRYRSKG